MEYHDLIKGRAQVIKIKLNDVNDKILNVVNVYAPNLAIERGEFFHKLASEIEPYSLRGEDLTIVGDFNVVTNEKDRLSRGRKYVQDKTGVDLNNIMSKLNMFDTWRRLNPDKIEFSWHCFNSVNPENSSASRIDKIYASKGLLPYVMSCVAVPRSVSDHSPIILGVHNIDLVEKGKGLWKMNCEILKNPIFNREVEILWNDFCENKPLEQDKLLGWWDDFKAQVGNLARKIGKGRAKLKNFTLNKLQGEFAKDVESFDKNPSNDLVKKILDIKSSLEEIEKEKLNGERVRAKVKWHEEGEKSSKYFLSSEVYRAKNKLIAGLKNPAGDVISDSKGMLELGVNFYSELYRSGEVDLHAQSKFVDNLNLKLSEEEKNSCESEMSKEEVLNALKSFKNNKSPGSDGIPKEFYIHFWEILGEAFTDLLNACHDIGELPESMRLAILILLYKDGLKDELKNWRPISLLNTDYKAMARVLSNRMRKVIGSVIRPDQTCGVPGRFIHENIIFTQDCIIYANKENKPLAIVSIDMTKAFDRVNREFLFKIMEKLNFGEKFLKWVKIMYLETSSRLIINGNVSKSFRLTRGVRQGCPLSPLLYIICAESLLEYVRKNETVKGFVLPTGSVCSKAKGYADDGNFYLNDIISVEFLLEIIEMYGKASESKLNRGKTKLFLAGALKYENPVHLGVQILREKLKVLGVWLGTENCDKDNWDPVIDKVTNIFKIWQMRNLSIFGKACIIQVLALAKVWYLGSVLTPPEWVLSKLEKEINTFLWRGKSHLINKDISQLRKDHGGLGLTCIGDKCKILKIKWLKLISDGRENNPSDWIKMANYFIMNFSQNFYDLNILSLKSFHLYRRQQNLVPTFYLGMIKTWQELDLERRFPSMKIFRKQYLWYDPFLFKTETGDFEFMSLGIYRVEDILVPGTDNIIDNRTFVQNFCQRTRHEKVIKLTDRFDTIRGFLVDIIRNIPQEEAYHNKIKIEDLFKIKENTMKVKNLYWALRDKRSYVNYRVRKYLGFVLTDKFFHDFYSTLWKSDIDNKNKALLWLLSWEGVLVGHITKNWFQDEDGVCKICKLNEETLSHLFFECNIIKEFWLWLHTILNIEGREANGLMLYMNNYTVLNECYFFLCAKGKLAIWVLRNKCVFQNTQPSLMMLKKIWGNLVKEGLETVLTVYKKKGRELLFMEKYCQDVISVFNGKIAFNFNV